MARKDIVIAVAGVSASGKTTLSEALFAVGFNVMRSVTTRPRRHLETDEAYDFVSVDEFVDMVNDGELVEYQRFGKYWYGLSKTEMMTSGDSVVVLTVGGLQQVMSSPMSEGKTIIPVFLDCGWRTMLRRMRGRGDSWRHVARRTFLAIGERVNARRAGIEFVDAEQPVMDVSYSVKLKVGMTDPEAIMRWV